MVCNPSCLCCLVIHLSVYVIVQVQHHFSLIFEYQDIGQTFCTYILFIHLSVYHVAGVRDTAGPVSHQRDGLRPGLGHVIATQFRPVQSERTFW